MAKLPNGEIKYKDPNMYHEGVLIYRETFGLTPNKGFRADIAVSVKTYDDLLIWSQLVTHWGYTDKKTGKWKARNPLDVKSLLTCFEFKQREAQRKKDEIQQKALSDSSRQRLPARSVRPVLEPEMFRLSKGASGWRG